MTTFWKCTDCGTVYINDHDADFISCGPCNMQCIPYDKETLEAEKVEGGPVEE
jgi:predicted  nucleic acid-binding Zn-ribbon protein